MKSVHDPFASIIETIDSGLDHISLSLQLTKPPKSSLGKKDASTDGAADLEASAEKPPAPGEAGFAAYYERKLSDFKVAKRIALRTWSEEKGIELPPDFFERPSSDMPDLDEFLLDKSGVGRDRSRRQLYLFLYVSAKATCSHSC
jgi:hypothetical protein